MAENKIVHFEIAGRNGEKMHEFYNKLFDWEITFTPEMNYYECCTGEGNVGGGLFQIDENKGMRPYVTFYIQVDDLQTYLDKAVSLGGEIVMPPMEISPEYGFAAMFFDPDKNLIGLWQAPEKK